MVSLQEFLGGLLRKLSSFDLTYLDFTLGTLIIFFPRAFFVDSCWRDVEGDL
jgi:hypothetical protein